MISVVSADTHPQYLELLKSWFLAEWEKVDPLVHPQAAHPPALFALSGDGQLAGGLSFTEHPAPDAQSQAQ